MVVLLYHMRQVDCRACGVRVETVPWGIGKHQLTKALFLSALGAEVVLAGDRRVSFRTSWDKVCQSVEYVVQWVDQGTGTIMVAWLSASKSVQSIATTMELRAPTTYRAPSERGYRQQLITLIGLELAGGSTCSDMWHAYLRVIKPRCSQAATFSPGSNHADPQGRRVLQHAKGGIVERVDTLGVKKARWCEHAARTCRTWLNENRCSTT